MNDLFTAKFLGAITTLSMTLKSVSPRASHGLYQASATGSSLDFRDFHPYSPGDDLRRVDWNVYKRTQHLFLRRFDHPTAVPINVLVDASASMFVESPSRYATAARLAAAVISASVQSQNNVHLGMLCDENTSPPMKVRGRASYVRALRELSSHKAALSGGASSVHRILSRWSVLGQRSVVVVISDFLDPAGAESIVEALSKITDRLLLLRITQPWDNQPQLQLSSNETTLVDCESNKRCTVSSDARELSRYLQAYHNHFMMLETYARGRGAPLVSFDASGDILPQLELLFPSGVLAI